MQRVHFQVRVGVSLVKTNIPFVNFDIVVKKQIECDLAWSVLLSTTIRVITVVKMLWTREAQISPQQIELHHKARACFS